MQNSVHVNQIRIGRNAPLLIIAGPCVIENFETTLTIASKLKQLTDELSLPFIFKASFDKANRTSINSYRGPGLKKGIRILAEIKDKLGVNILSDVHEAGQIDTAAQVLDVIQIPAFLCRQTDFVLSVARSGKAVNIKKGQFLAPWDIAHVIEKIQSSGNESIFVTERGTMFGYNNLVVDFRGINIMQNIGFPVIFDATHSVQLPGGQGQSSGGQRQYAPLLARSAAAAGADGIFLEVHPDPDQALCDGPNSLSLSDLPDLLRQLKAIHKIVENPDG
jgi:2-dehydro-3-deoxyphosphooctonate aldolase (KDO 8-P synthase)